MADHLTERNQCPDCGSDDIEYDPPYCLCNDCGWEGRDRPLTEQERER